MIVSSAPLTLRKLYTFNTIERLSSPQQWNLNKFIRGRATLAWKDGNLEDAESVPEYPLAFYLFTALPRGRAPDADSSMWIAKRFLDGAQDAGIIANDGPGYLRATTVVSAQDMETLPYGIGAVYAGVLTDKYRIPAWDFDYA